MNICGIYQILNLITEKFYVGSSYRIIKRWKDHVRFLNENRHPNKYLQASWNLHGADAFEFIIIEACDKDDLLKREQYWIDNLECVSPIGYNANPFAGSRLGTKHSEATLIKLRAKVISDKHKEQIAISTRGRKASEETKAKIKKGNLGKVNTEEAKERMRQAWAKRKGESYQPLEFTATPLIKGKDGWI